MEISRNYNKKKVRKANEVFFVLKYHIVSVVDAIDFTIKTLEEDQ